MNPMDESAKLLLQQFKLHLALPRAISCCHGIFPKLHSLLSSMQLHTYTCTNDELALAWLVG